MVSYYRVILSYISEQSRFESKLVHVSPPCLNLVIRFTRGTSLTVYEVAQALNAPVRPVPRLQCCNKACDRRDRRRNIHNYEGENVGPALHLAADSRPARPARANLLPPDGAQNLAVTSSNFVFQRPRDTDRSSWRGPTRRGQAGCSGRHHPCEA